jgi:hypothetical protein
VKLVAYVIDGHSIRIRPAPLERAWMEQSDQRFAYRCLPLNIANGHGWEILCDAGFSSVWDGGSNPEAVTVVADAEGSPPAIGHFGSGVLTFHVKCVFATEPGYDLLVTGPINAPKDAISPLTAVVETDWSPYTFTMNWLFTRPHTPVRFEADEPFCHVFPVKRDLIEQTEPQLKKLSENPRLHDLFQQWTRNRSDFNADLKIPGSDAREAKWQRSYFQGLDPAGAPGTPQHRNKLRAKPFSA